jgi:hypothetical protein
MMIETDDLTITVERQSDEFRIVFTTKVAWTRTISPWDEPRCAPDAGLLHYRPDRRHMKITGRAAIQGAALPFFIEWNNR